MPKQHSVRARRAKRWLDNGLVVVIIALFGLGAAAVLSGNYQVRPVLGGSMEPTLPVGGVVITERVPTSTLRVRDVVVFHPPGQPINIVVHRIVALTPGADGLIVQTKGDANRIADPWKFTMRGKTAYRSVYSVPLLGYVPVWVHSPAGRQTLMFGGLLLIVGAAAGSLIYRRRSAKGATRQVAQPDVPDAPDLSGLTLAEVEAALHAQDELTSARH